MRIVWFLIYIFLLVAGCASVSGIGKEQPVFMETIDRVKCATVPIVCGSPTKDNVFDISIIMGTAFFINEEGYFLTAGHVLDDWDKIDKSKHECSPAIYMAVGCWETKHSTKWHWFTFAFDSCTRTREADFAVCKPINNPFLNDVVKNQVRFLTFGNFEDVKDGTPIAFTGFPLNSLQPLTSQGNIASYAEKDKKIVIDKNSWPGASGSPVYLSNGNVVGILIEGGIKDAIGLGYARPAESAMEFLRTNKIRFDQMK